MPKRELPLFSRDLHEQPEPSEHQRKFLYLPLPIFREYTNIRSIVLKYDRRKGDKPLKEIEINQKIKKYHSEMDKLRKWDEMHLDELDFTWPDAGGAERV